MILAGTRKGYIKRDLESCCDELRRMTPGLVKLVLLVHTGRKYAHRWENNRFAVKFWIGGFNCTYRYTNHCSHTYRYINHLSHTDDGGAGAVYEVVQVFFHPTGIVLNKFLVFSGGTATFRGSPFCQYDESDRQSLRRFQGGNNIFWGLRLGQRNLARGRPAQVV